MAYMLLLIMGAVQIPHAPPTVRREMVVTTDTLERNLGDSAWVVLHVGFPDDARDAKSRSRYEDGHIPGARYVDFADVAVTRKGLLNELPPAGVLVDWVRRAGIDAESRIVLYDTGSGMEAARVYVALDYLGLGDRASMLDGQWKAWKAEGRPVSKETPKVRPSTFLPGFRPEVIVPYEAMLDAVWFAVQPRSPVALIDSRPASEYTGDKAGAAVERAGHLPGAASVWWVRNLVSRDDPRLRPLEELDAMYRAAGAAPGKLVVAHCRTGTQAAHTYFVLRYLGYDVRLYDGSITQWAAQSGTPVVRGSGCEVE